MQESGQPEAAVRAALEAARARDFQFAGGHILGSMCTEPHDMAKAAYQAFLPTNLGDPAHFPGTAQLEQDVLADMAQMLHAPDGFGARLLTGGTEANLLACAMARESSGKHTIVVPDSAHFSFQKAAKVLGMRLRTVPTKDHRADPDAMCQHLDDAALVVAVAGTTELGLVDPVRDIASRAADAGVACHVDAAYGGYVLPFIDGFAPVDFRIDGVTSIGLDPHKMGMAAIPAGALVTRTEAAWDNLAVETDYVSTTSQATLMGTRPGAAAAAIWATHRRLGMQGYKDVVRQCFAVRDALVAGLTQAGARLVCQPELTVVTFHDDSPQETLDALAAAGFRLNIVPRFGALRIVVGPHVTLAAVESFLEAYKRLKVTA